MHISNSFSIALDLLKNIEQPSGTSIGSEYADHINKYPKDFRIVLILSSSYLPLMQGPDFWFCVSFVIVTLVSGDFPLCFTSPDTTTFVQETHSNHYPTLIGCNWGKNLLKQLSRLAAYCDQIHLDNS